MPMQSTETPPPAKQAPRIVVAMTGASGALYGVRLLESLRVLGAETHLVISKAGALSLRHELGMRVAQLQALADHAHPIGDVAASIASGSFQTQGMAVAPCSVKTLGEIASGITGNLISRAADVVLKERRRLVLMLRETPLHLGHIRCMAQVTEMGGVIFPPVPAFYTQPKTLADLVDHSVGRVLDLLGIESDLAERWEGRTQGGMRGGAAS